MSQAPIMIASDLSSRSDRAIARGIALARKLNAPVEIISILDGALPEDMATEMANRAKERLSHQAAPLAGEDMSISVDVHVGHPCEDIIERIDALNPQLLVMGTHRSRRFLDMLRETTMQRIVRRSDCTALLVREPADRPYTRIISGTDFSPAAAQVVKTAQRLSDAQAEVLPIHALHIPFTGRLGHTPELSSELETSFRKDALSLDSTWRQTYGLTGLAPTKIVTTAAHSALEAEVQAGPTENTIMAVGAHGRVGANRAVLGSVVTDLLRDPPCDVLVARP